MIFKKQHALYGKVISFFVISSIIYISAGTTPTVYAIREVDTLTSQLDAIHSYMNRTYTQNIVTPPTPSVLRDSIRRGIEWLKHAQESNGHFRYEYLPYEGNYRDDDNIVRQTGALYVLGEIARRDTKNAYNVTETIIHALEYFKSQTKFTVVQGKTIGCIANSTASSKCQLGATSLALIGVLDLIAAEPKEKSNYTDLITAYGTFILHMQKDTGGFRNVFALNKDTQVDTESAFSNGEALHALVRYYMYDPDPKVTEAIDAAFAYLNTQPYDANLYLWIMAALKDMQTLWPQESYLNYAQSFTEWRIERARGLIHTHRNYCAYAEGLASAIGVLQEDIPTEKYMKFRYELDRLNQKHLALQLTARDTIRLLPSDGTVAFHTLKNPAQALGGFLTEDREPTQRIDFTQHCLSAYMQTLVDIDGHSL